MVRYFCRVLLIMVLGLCGIFSAAAPACAEAFDGSAFAGLDGYTFDKFTKTWRYDQMYIQTYSDARIVVGLRASGGENGPDMPTLYAKIIAADDTDPLNALNLNIKYSVNGIDLLIGDLVFSYDAVYRGDDGSSVVLGEKGKSVVLAMANADEISVRVRCKATSTSFDISAEDYAATLKPVAENLIRFDLWSSVSDADGAWAASEQRFPLVVY